MSEESSENIATISTLPFEERIESLIHLGIRKGYLIIREERIYYPHCEKNYIFSDPEEKIRAATYVDLIEKYQYAPIRIDLEVISPRREPRLPADIVIFTEDEREHAYIVVEVKATGEKSKIDEATREGLGNSNLLRSRFLLLICGPEKMAYDVSEEASLRLLDRHTIADIPRNYGRIPQYKYQKANPDWELRNASYNELSSKFKLCHDEIWEGGRRDPSIAFDEISKLMLAKIYDERFTPNGEYYKFQIGTHEDASEVSSRIIEESYNLARAREPDVFSNDIELPPQIIFRIVEILQEISLLRTDLDSKGRAFETFLGTLFRGEYGQYFTRREIVEFMVSVLDPDDQDLIMDPACGSGGFLLYTLKHVREKINERYAGDQRTIDRIEWEYAHNQVFGIEINDRIARVAMMDMVIHEDGHSNIETHDALAEYDEFDARKEIRPEKYHLVLTNPPFGASVRDENTLNRFELGRTKNSQRTETLFLERCLELLRPEGKLGIIVPDGLLTTISQHYVRDWILNNAKITAVVSLPPSTFVPAGSGVKASILFLKKKNDDRDENYRIFMSIARHIGYDATGRPDRNDFPEILDNYQMFLEGNILNQPQSTFVIERDELESRLDPYYYLPEFIELERILDSSRYPLLTLDEILSYMTGGATPTAKSDAYTDEENGIPFLRIQNIEEGTIKLEDVKFITEDIHSNLLSRSRILPGDILYTITGRVGTTALVPEGFGNGNINQHIVLMRIKPEIELNSNYLVSFLNSELGGFQAQRKATGATRIALDYQAIKSIKVPIPPMDIQNEIAEDFLESIEESERLQRQSIEVIKDSKIRLRERLM